MNIWNVASKASRRNRFLEWTGRFDGSRRIAGSGMVPLVRRIVTFAAAAFFFALPAEASNRTLKLRDPPPVAKEAAAMPLIANPSDDAERRINAALKRLDANLSKAILACKRQDGGPGDWVRKVEPTMRGPRYISYVIRDMAFCGGPYPSIGTMSIVYDLETGFPVDWARLLPPAISGKVALTAGMDGTKMVTLSSPRLYSLYLSGYDRASRMPGNDIAAEDVAACKEAVQDTANPPMMVWLDARSGGLTVQFDLPHAVQACAVPVAIPVEVLRADGVNSGLLDAIAAARRE
jgi:hypothetical protein